MDDADRACPIFFGKLDDREASGFLGLDDSRFGDNGEAKPNLDGTFDGFDLVARLIGRLKVKVGNVVFGLDDLGAE